MSVAAPQRHRLLLVDAGNSTCSAAVADGRRVKRVGQIATKAATPAAMAALTARAAGKTPFDGAVLCSVVPSLDTAWMRALRAASRTPPLRVTAALRFDMPIRYPRPETIGADRLVNAAAAKARFGAPVVALDSGSALTADVVDADGAFCGGIIAPGLRLFLDYLHERTERLPAIPFRPVRRPVGRSTEEAMRIGAWNGYRGLVRELAADLRRTLGPAVRFCATGGDASRIRAILGDSCRFVPNLTFEGMRLLYDWNPPPYGESMRPSRARHPQPRTRHDA